MKLHHAILFVLSFALVPAARASSVSWMFQPGSYTHSPQTGKRVAQYQPERPSYIIEDPTYQESGYRHQDITLGNDHFNFVQTWGLGTAIRPYGEWLYPYRAGATPYGPWGNPQGPWTLPFDSWRNPYGLNRPSIGYGPWQSGNGQMGNSPWQSGPQYSPGQSPMGSPGNMPLPPAPGQAL